MIRRASDCAGDLRAKARRGVRQMLIRQAAIQAVTFVSGIFLARMLSPAEFGLFAIVSFIITFSNLIGDLGLGASIIQSREGPGDREFQVAFTLQQFLLGAVTIALFFSAPAVPLIYPEMAGLDWLVRAMCLAILLGSWRSISASIMERDLKYDRLALVETAEVVVYQGTALAMAAAGFGVWSFISASMAKGVLGAVMAYAFAPWKIRLMFNQALARKLLRFGLQYQFQSVVNQLNTAVIPILVGVYGGESRVGHLTWASSNAGKPLALVENVSRVSFSLFSRLQDSPAEIEEVLARYLSWLMIPVFGWIALVVCSAREMVEVVYTAKWAGAVTPLVIFSLSLPFTSIIWLAAMSLQARKKMREVSALLVLRAALFWAAALLLIRAFDISGIALAYLLSTALISMAALRLSGKGLPARLGLNVWRAVVCLLLAVFFTVMAKKWIVSLGAVSLLVQGVFGLAAGLSLYLLLLWILLQRHYRDHWAAWLKGLIKGKRVDGC